MSQDFRKGNLSNALMHDGGAPGYRRQAFETTPVSLPERRMIDLAIAQIASQLNQALRRQFMADEDLVVLANLHEQDGTVATHIANKLVVSLVGVEREDQSRQGVASGLLGGRAGLYPAPVHLNLMLMFAANFGGSNYPEALKFIASTVAFFQGRPVFDAQNTPDLDRRLHKLTLEIENLSVADLSNLWGMLSGKYLPSVLYRMRLVSIDAEQITAQVPRVSKPAVGVSA